MQDSVDSLIGQMTLEEKVSLLAGAAMFATAAVERLGVPSLRMTDGPNGARGADFTGGLTAACLPVGISLAASWNAELIGRVGQVLAQEAKSKGAQVLLAPTVNIHRSPLNGRNFECYSEDPYLTARLAVAFIKGVQSEGVGATVKHFVCNDSEFERNTISSEVRERPLREIYLAPFKAAVQEAKSWAVMASYNRVNGTYVGESPYLLTDVLRNELGFDGLVMSDWFGTRSTAEALNAGLDLEMPGPTSWRGAKLLEAVERGEVAEATIDASVRRLLELLERTGRFANPEDVAERSIDRPEHRAVARQAAAEGIVVLKNERDVLPLRREGLKSLAVIGPNAKVARIMGGGSARVNAHYAITPFDGLTAKLGSDVAIGYELGCTNHKALPLLEADQLKSGGVEVEFFGNPDLAGAPVHAARSRTTELVWIGKIADAVNPLSFSARGTATLTPRETGTFTFGLASSGRGRLLVDGREVIDNWTRPTPGWTFFGGAGETMATVDLVAGREHTIVVEYGSGAKPSGMSALRLGCLPPVPTDAIGRAARLAAESDVALVFVGLNGEWESEGFDRPNLELVGEQNALVERVAAANPNTVVVLNTGSPIAMPWLDRVAAVVQAWYPGQECGNAIADVLFGDVPASGKLPQTFPLRLEDNPAYLNYPGENGRVHYGEGIFVGYRYYEKKGIAPLFPFGHGLSYTTFGYGALRLSRDEIGPNDKLTVSVDVANTGELAGKEVVQLYVRDVVANQQRTVDDKVSMPLYLLEQAPPLQRPEKELKGFAKVELQPGESRIVSFQLGWDALAFFDDRTHSWVAEAGEFEVLVGSSSRDIRAVAGFRLNETGRFPA